MSLWNPKKLQTLTQEQVMAALNYDPATGIFRRRAASGGASAGSVAGTFDGRGYRQIRVAGKKYLAHKLAWIYVYGEWPSKHLDHVNRIKDDNRISNLREVTRSQNGQNRGIQKNNTSCYRGVCWDTGIMRWRARIGLNGKRTFLGYFDTAEAAYEAYKAAAVAMHPYNPIVEAA